MEPDTLDVELQVIHLAESSGLIAGQKRKFVLPLYDQCKRTEWLLLQDSCSSGSMPLVASSVQTFFIRCRPSSP